jgi:hypothetical protein
MNLRKVAVGAALFLGLPTFAAAAANPGAAAASASTLEHAYPPNAAMTTAPAFVFGRKRGNEAVLVIFRPPSVREIPDTKTPFSPTVQHPDFPVMLATEPEPNDSYERDNN